MSIFVLDASVAAVWLLSSSKLPESEKHLRLLEENEVVVPHLWHAEIGNILVIAMRRRQITIEQAAKRLDCLYDLKISTDGQLDQKAALKLGRKHILTFYDAIYLELAIRRAVPLATFDKALAKSAVAERVPLVFKDQKPFVGKSSPEKRTRE